MTGAGKSGPGKTGEQQIDYEGLAQNAMRGVVRAVLSKVAKSGLPGEHHFYIAFNTQAPGVTISKRLKEKYRDEMTIVLQHRFWDLAVQDDRFEVKLTFDAIPERLIVPFSAVKVFFDPSVPYGLQFEAGHFEMSDDAPGGGGDNQRDGIPDRIATTEETGTKLSGPRAVPRLIGERGDRKPVARKSKPARPGDDGILESVKAADTDLPPPRADKSSPVVTTVIEGGKAIAPAPAGSDATKVVQLDKFRKK